MVQSKEFMEANRDKINTIAGIVFDIKVINCNWPYKQSPGDTIKLPSELAHFEQKFLEVYNSKYKNYRTNILYNQGTAEITFKTKKKYRLIVSTYQSIILFHSMKHKDGISFAQLRESTGINDREFEFNLVFLLKNKVINKKSQE